jgi:hypothetical protein
MLLLSLFCPGRGLALCIDAPFEGQIAWADIIFAGTLDRSDVVRVHGSITTRYHFSNVRYVKGTGSKDEFVLLQVGGSIGNEEMISEDGLTFIIGRRYVAYAHRGGGQDSAGYYALYSCGTNLFGIWAETPSDSPAVHVGNGQPVIALGDPYLLLLRPQTWEVAHPPSAYQVFERPPKRSLEEELRTADSTYEADRARQDPPGGVRFFGLWPHQDPGTRVAEGPFIDWLSRVCKRVAEAEKQRAK